MIIWVILAWVVSLCLVGMIAWHFGKNEGVEAERYRQETARKMEKYVPYGDRFRKDLLLDPNNPPPLLVVHRRRKLNGKWTEV